MNAASPALLLPRTRHARLALGAEESVAPWSRAHWAAPAPDGADLWLVELSGAWAAADPAAREDAWASEARAHLRALLGRALGVAPQDVALLREAHGKPALRARGRPPFFFNASRSGRLALFALSAVAELGVDIERRPLIDSRALRLWARHEAIAKAAGTGLSVRFRSPEALASAAGSLQFGGRLWAWRDLDLPQDAGAVAVLAFSLDAERARCG